VLQRDRPWSSRRPAPEKLITRYAAVANFTTVTVHRIGVLDLSSLTARIIPVTGTPFKINLAFWPRYWA
jgi:hypothetical protein